MSTATGANTIAVYRWEDDGEFNQDPGNVSDTTNKVFGANETLDSADRERELLFVSNPPFLPVAMWIACKLRGWEYTYIVYDLYPDQPVELGHIEKGGLIDRIWSWLNGAAFRGANHVVALGPVMEDRIADQAGPHFDRDTVTIIHNWEDKGFIEPKSKTENWFSKEHGLIEPFSVLYSGNIAEFHDLETLVRGADEFPDEDVRFCIIGEGDNKEKIVEVAERRGVRGDTVKFLPYQPWDDLPYSLTSADVSVVAVNEGFEGVCVSSKMYTAMAAGMPILAIVRPDDDEARIIDAFDAGIHVPQGDTEGIVEAVHTWRENPDLVAEQGSNARAAFEDHFTEDESVDRYYRLLEEGSVEPDLTCELSA